METFICKQQLENTTHFKLTAYCYITRNCLTFQLVLHALCLQLYSTERHYYGQYAEAYYNNNLFTIVLHAYYKT